MTKFSFCLFVVFILQLLISFSFISSFKLSIVRNAIQYYSSHYTRARTSRAMRTPYMQSRPQHLSNDAFSFSQLRELDDRVLAISKQEPSYLLSFYSPTLNCFKLYADLASDHVSITSTCMVLTALLANAEVWRNDAQWSADGSKKISLENIVHTIKLANWTFDSLQLPVVVSTLARLQSLDRTDPKFVLAVERLLEQRSRISMHRNQPNSAYLRLQNTRALLAVVENGIVPVEMVGTHKIGYALERNTLVAFDEMCRQLAFYHSGDVSNFNAVVLAFTTISYFETSQSLFLKSFARGVVPATEIKLVRAALKVVFSCQREDGTWLKGEPISKQGSSKSLDIGNNYVFFLDMVSSFLAPGGMAEKEPELLAPYLPQLELCLTWIESNILEEMRAEDCDAVTGRCYGALVKGWRSNHLGAGGAVSWCTAQVCSALSGMHRLLKALITTSILTEFKGRKAAGSASPTEWRSLMDADLELSGLRSTFKAELEPRVLLPQVKKEQSLLESLLPPPLGLELTPPTLSTQTAAYSLILFGPPGTAKTTTCTSMAAYLGWNFLTIDTACFLADGLENVARRMTYIFERLEALEKTIILFDEVEEFCLDRENPNLGMESRMLTTAMLTQLNDLRRRQASIFIVATNRLRSFDAAVTRPGRFDMLIFLGTPNLASRVGRLRSKLATSRLPAEEQEQAVTVIEEYLDSRWENMRFFTFAENEAFLNAAIDLSISGGLSRDALSKVAQSIRRTATIQHAVKEDYLLSETMSRI